VLAATSNFRNLDTSLNEKRRNVVDIALSQSL
jgi:hypothetical protein